MSYRISVDKMKHIHGVAEYMCFNANAYGCDSADMYLLGLLHDIGYVYGKESHAEYGSMLLKRNGYKFSDIVIWHGHSPQDYLKVVGGKIPNELRLLWTADLMISPDGKNIGWDSRLKEIGERLGFDSEAYKIAKETIEWLSVN